MKTKETKKFRGIIVIPLAIVISLVGGIATFYTTNIKTNEKIYKQGEQVIENKTNIENINEKFNTIDEKLEQLLKYHMEK